MQRVRVKASREYDVIISKGIIDNSGRLAAEVIKPCKAALITDSTVAKLYGERVKKSLKDAGFDLVEYVFPAGEHSKNTAVLIDILNFLGNSALTRSDVIFALGGGVCGDMAGFAASCYLRGIRFIQIPTTFLAAIDSSVGGKTGVNLECGKNLMGAFYQPSMVICDIDTFTTLPEEVFADGTAEAIKYGAIFDRRLFDILSENMEKWDLANIVKRCVEIKADIVNADERDTGVRQLLNFGHTIGHAIEKNSDYEITHGHAVSMGMVMASAAVDEAVADEIVRLCKKHKLPVACEYNKEQLLSVALSDKKRTGDFITLVVPEKIGKCVLTKVPTAELGNFIEKGLCYGSKHNPE